MVTGVREEGWGVNWETGINLYTLLYIKLIRTYIQHRELYSILSNDLYGKRFQKKGYMYS